MNPSVWYHSLNVAIICGCAAMLKRRILMRSKITLACTDCKQRNYNTTKEKKNHPDRMEIKKFCRFCNKHTNHRETK